MTRNERKRRAKAKAAMLREAVDNAFAADAKAKAEKAARIEALEAVNHWCGYVPGLRGTEARQKAKDRIAAYPHKKSPNLLPVKPRNPSDTLTLRYLQNNA